MLARFSGFSTTLLLGGTEGGVTPFLCKRGILVRYGEDSKDMHIEADPTEIGIQSDNRLVPVPPALLLNKDRDFGANRNNSEIAKLSAQEELAALQDTNSPSRDVLLFGASLMLWLLERFSSVNEASVSARKILSGVKAAERFNRAA